ncbi:MAG: PH domain-containing protein [Candidatus Aenigmatarchaeota archaeon]
MRIKPSIISEMLNLILISLIGIILLLLFISFKVNLFTITPLSIFSYVLIIIAFILIDEILIKLLYTYEIEEDGIREIFVLFSKKETFIPYPNIMKVNLYKSFWGRLLNYGNIIIYGSGEKEIVIRGIRKPEEIYETIKNKTKGGQKE